jgi:hypothetical protein
VDEQVLADYGAWLAGEISRLEEEGYDLDVSVSMPLRGVLKGNKGQESNAVLDTQVVLKRENEASDFRSWSAMFSPMGFRVIGFTAVFMAAAHFGRDTRWGLGQCAPQGDSWGVLFNNDTRTMRVLVPLNPRGQFDPEEMTEKLMAALPEEGHTNL